MQFHEVEHKFWETPRTTNFLWKAPFAFKHVSRSTTSPYLQTLIATSI
jgi:hypothetical protein